MAKFVAVNLESPTRLDKLLAEKLPHYSRTQWRKLIIAGQVQVNNRVAEPRTIIHLKDQIVYPTTPTQAVSDIFKQGYWPKLEYLYQDDSVIVINKPAGLITHPTHANSEDSVVHRILAHHSDVRSVVWDAANPVSLMRPGIVHRLDKDTSGVMIIAKTVTALHFLAQQIQTRQIKKKYIALLFGWLEQDPTRVHNWLNRDAGNRRRMTPVGEGDGREATTIFHINKLLTTVKGDHATLCDAEPITGRTHQIRVHAAHIDHPLLGDFTYGNQQSERLSKSLGLSRQFLHAAELTILLPNHHTPSTFKAPLAGDLTAVLRFFSSDTAN